jgi:excinuclease ABC subunit A
MTVEEAEEFFAAVPAIREKLSVLRKVGLGYIHLGQQATTLSGGEAQRIKLSKELSRRATGRTLYILDEPTTGLHFEDVRKLLEVLHALVETGNTVVVIEHNLEVIKTADWVLDLGPEGGEGGGRLVAEGTPEDIAAAAESHTGPFALLPVYPGRPIHQGETPCPLGCPNWRLRSSRPSSPSRCMKRRMAMLRVPWGMTRQPGLGGSA